MYHFLFEKIEKKLKTHEKRDKKDHTKSWKMRKIVITG